MKRVPAAAIPIMAVLMGLPTAVAPGSIVANGAYTVAFGSFLVFAWLGVRQRTGRARTAHALAAGALTVWFAGDQLYTILEWRYGELDTVTAADVLWVAGYPLLAGGLLLMVRLRAPGRLREAGLDVLAMAIVAAALCWEFMVAPAVGGADHLLDLLFTAFYPFGDVLLFAAVALIALAPGRWNAPARYLVTALGVTLAGDVTISVLSVVLPDFDSARLDPVLLVANGMIAAALWHPDAGRLTEPGRPGRERLHPARVVFLGVALLSLPALNYVGLGRDTVGRFTTLAALMLLTVVVLIRFTLAVRASEHASEILAYRAAHDQLTGLVNRQELRTRLAEALRAGGTTVHFLDLDGFKPINDRYGHAAGDFVLTEVATRLRAAAREADTVARLGGDEFVVLSDAVDDPAALTERLRRAISAPLRYQGHELRLSVSIGCARATVPGEHTSDSLLGEADARMYSEKHAGSGTVKH